MWIFLFTNSISLVIFPSLTSARFAFFLLIVTVVIKSKQQINLKKVEFFFIFFTLMLSIYVLNLSVVKGTDLIQFSRLFHYLFFSIIAPFLIVKIITSESRFHQTIVISVLIQIVFVFITYTNREFNETLFSIVLANNNFGDSLGRAPGLSSSGGATLSVTIGLAAFSILRLSRIARKAWHLPAIILITLSTVVVGRTGLLLCIIALGMYFTKAKFSMKPLIFIVGLSTLAWFTLLDSIMSNEQFVNYTLKWAISGITGDGTATALLSMGVPEMSNLDILFGTGSVASQNGFNSSGSDVGYIQTLFSIGLVLTVIFYFSLFIFLSSYVPKSTDKSYACLIVSLPFILELKEPFVFKYSVVFFVFSSLLYMQPRIVNK